MSFHNPESELSYLNREASEHPCVVSREMEEVLTTALNLSRLTQGIYDISIAPQLVKMGMLPGTMHHIDEQADWQDITITNGKVSFQKRMLLDLGGIAKGYAVDKAFSILENETEDLIVNAGGDLRRKRWNGESVGIKATNAKGQKYSVNLPMKHTALATSASYYMEEGKNAIINPLTGKPAEDKRSLSIFAPNCMVADALTKIAFLDPNGAAVIRSFGATAVAVDESGKVINVY